MLESSLASTNAVIIVGIENEIGAGRYSHVFGAANNPSVFTTTEKAVLLVESPY